MLRTLVRAAAEGSFLGVDWGAFAVVALVACVASVVIVVSYALGLRLLAVGSPLASGADEGSEAASAGVARRNPLAVAGAAVCFAVGAAAVLYGVWLIVPQFH